MPRRAGPGKGPSGAGRWMAALGMACAGIAVLAGAAPVAAAAEPRPNVLVILTDDMRWDAIGAVQRDEGQRALFPWFETPHLDRLVREGCRFKAAFVTTSLCSPSRASLISGRYAHRHGVRDNFTDYPAALPGYPRRLQEAGYETAYIGKWHMGEDDDAARPGFDFWMSHKGQGAYHDNEFIVDGTRRVIPGYYTTVVTDAALEWLDRPHPAPWLLVVGHKAPHGGPIVPEERYEHAFDRLPVVEPANAGSYRAADGKPAWLERSFPTWHGLGGPLYGRKEYGAFVRAYLGCIASVDDSVGRIVERLEASGRLDDTIVIFTSDNGFALGEHGRVDKRTAYEESIRVPLVVRYPRRATPGSVVERMVLALDLAPSILDLCGLAPLPDADGRSWAPLLAGDAAGWRTSFLYQYDYERQFPYTPNVRAVRTEDWKFIRYPHGDGGADRHAAELYDLRADPLETRNLAGDPAHAADRDRLAAELDRLQRAHGALPDRPPLDEGIRDELPKF